MKRKNIEDDKLNPSKSKLHQPETDLFSKLAFHPQCNQEFFKCFNFEEIVHFTCLNRQCRKELLGELHEARCTERLYYSLTNVNDEKNVRFF